MKNILFAVLLVFLYPHAFGQETDKETPIPYSKKVKRGMLDNGLKYYIRENKKPENRAELRLVINTGSILEDEKQLGLAHFLEHMNFNGTKRFPKNALIDYIQSIGLTFGQHLNAYTGFDETVYILPIPTEDEEIVDTGLDILEDWAFNAVLEPEEVEKEKGVVLEELRSGLGADKRMLDKYLPVLTNFSRYADRLPIGKKESIENLDIEDLRRFKNDWYRPNLMAVIVVGDIEADKIEQKIKERFSSYKNPIEEKERSTYSSDNHTQTLVSIVKDPEANNTQASIYYKDPTTKKGLSSIYDLREDFKNTLISIMINNRLRDIALQPNPPFIYAWSGYEHTWERYRSAYISSTATEEGGALKGLETLLMENNRVRKHGFLEAELKRAKKDLSADIENKYKERNTTESELFVHELIESFLINNTVIDPEWLYNIKDELINSIHLNEINKTIKNHIRNDNQVIVITSPEKPDIEKITEIDVFDIITSVEQMKIEPYTEEEESELMKNIPQKGSILSQENNEQLGITILKLSNGAKVTYKKTDFNEDEVILKAHSLGGTNLYSDEVYNSSKWALWGLSLAGLNGLSITELRKALSGHIANTSFYISHFSEGINGSSTSKDMEKLFQLTHLSFTALNKDKAAHENYKQRTISYIKNIALNPENYFYDRYESFKNELNPRFTSILSGAEECEKSDHDMAYKIYQERFADSSDFSFYVVGNFDEEKLKEYVETYIASLPSSNGTHEEVKDTGYRLKSGAFTKVIRYGIEPKSLVVIEKTFETKFERNDLLPLSAINYILEITLFEKLREEESGIYNIQVSTNLSRLPFHFFNFSVNFGCDPKNVDKLIRITNEEINTLIEEGISQEDLNKFIEKEKLSYKENLKQNEFWASYLLRQNIHGFALDRVFKFNERLNALNPDIIQATAKKYLRAENIIGILLPKEENENKE